MNVVRKILVVDDDPVVGKSIDRVLSSKGYAVITAENGEDALLKVNNEHYDVVFTDIRMPGISGLDVAEQVKASQPWLPVVIITGYGSGTNEERAAAAGVSGFLRKPLSPEMIQASAEKALNDLAAAVAPVLPAVQGAAQETPAAEAPRNTAGTIKNIALFLAAPMIGLAYIVAMPFVGIAMLVWFGSKALLKRN